VQETISYYQVASHLYREGLYRSISTEEQAQYGATATVRRTAHAESRSAS
jgi:hypothetical protein